MSEKVPGYCIRYTPGPEGLRAKAHGILMAGLELPRAAGVSSLASRGNSNYLHYSGFPETIRRIYTFYKMRDHGVSDPMGKTGEMAFPATLPVTRVAARRVSSKVALGETFRLALDALRAHKLRSFLTLLGIILAVATLVGVMSVVSGLNLYISDKVANLGANAFVVNRFGIITNQDEFLKAQKRPLVTYDDYQALLDHMKLAQAVAVLEVTTLDVRGGGQLDEDTNVFGVSPNYVEVRAIGIDRGRAISDADDEHRSAVCVL